MKLTGDQACVNYAEAQAEVKRLTREIGLCQCERIQKWFAANETYAMPTSCLKEIFAVEYEEQDEVERCAPCGRALELLGDRREARKKLGAAKRGVLSVGKRLNVPRGTLEAR